MASDAHPCRLILVRHGEAHCNVDNMICGERTCTGLTERGRRQAESLGEFLARDGRHGISAVYSTRAARTIQTAELVGTAIGRTVRPELLAPDYGAAEGLRWPDAIATSGLTPALAPDLPLAEGAESWVSLVQRTSRELAVVLRRHPSETVLVVAHEATVIAAAQTLLQLPPSSRAAVTFRVDFTSRTVWQREQLSWSDQRENRWRWRLVRANDTRHLADRGGPSPTQVF
ncbi:histidine phosphatase family protein [Nocardia sp. BMG51109]|uniref:histidine phosphatase family protein n=1 Tax=Nocardia sp. BMG51109 TaxID=1056816 RepID=UPI0004656DE4|nr:histidine phosphatase family protein [Nocardia sp. BMG51109]